MTFLRFRKRFHSGGLECRGWIYCSQIAARCECERLIHGGSFKLILK